MDEAPNDHVDVISERVTEQATNPGNNLEKANETLQTKESEIEMLDTCEVSDNMDEKVCNKKEGIQGDNIRPDPFAYVSQNGFTSEIFKIEVRGLPKHYGIGEFKKLLNLKLKLDCNKVKSPSLRSQWLYVCFRSEKDRGHAISVLSGYKWKGSVLTAKVADPAPDPFVKRRLEEINNESKPKRQKISSSKELNEALLKSTSPLWNMPYEDQIKKKTEEAKEILRMLSVSLVQQNHSLKRWIEDQKKANDGLPCKLLETRHLKDNFNNYRNKCEFTIGKDEVTGEKRVGMRLGTYASGSLGVGPIDELPIVPDIMKEAVKAVEKLVQNSAYDVFCPENLSGHWRQLTVRYGVGTGELMMIIGFHPQNLTVDEVSSVKNNIKEFFESNGFLKNSVTSLYFQPMKRKESGKPESSEIELLLGNKYIEEELCGLKFMISPESFFQINTKCAEVLMDSVKELAQLNKDTVLLDVCCGTGTIGLCLAKDCARVLGIEVVKQAVSAAKENAEKNNITNADFFCGKADEILTSVISRIPSDQKTVAILDPPRAGLHHKAILMLRKATNLKRFVFMSCDSKAAIKNFTMFGKAQSKTLAGDPFLPVSAVVVDMFPHTNHFELVIYFERIDISKYLTSN